MNKRQERELDRIITHRISAAGSQRKLAGLLKLNHSHLSNVLRGRRDLSFKLSLTLAEAFDLDPGMFALYVRHKQTEWKKKKAQTGARKAS